MNLENKNGGGPIGDATLRSGKERKPKGSISDPENSVVSSLEGKPKAVLSNASSTRHDVTSVRVPFLRSSNESAV